MDRGAKYNTSYNSKTNTITVIDLDWPGCMSVTNDADRVVATVVEMWKAPTATIYYKDSDGRWDQLVHENGRFIGFAPGPAEMQEQKRR